MRRNELERDEQFAWEVLRKAHYATLAMTGADGTPYCVPVNHVADEAYHVLYFHCAGAGEKWQLLEKEPPVCLTAVSRMSIVPNEFETAYDSAVVRGRRRWSPTRGSAPRRSCCWWKRWIPRVWAALPPAWNGASPTPRS